MKMSEITEQLQWMYRKLNSMDEKQLIELFRDLENFETIRRIAFVSCKVVNEMFTMIDNDIIGELDRIDNESDQSEDEEAKEIDDARRYRDHNSTKERPY